uniref:Eukaryotic elongation factor, selenocysteine-tRNA specific n=1 Tax=Bos indicus x Bos taurus TaxID=30522 RepID=A0A4W2FI42_BOBOX
MAGRRVNVNVGVLGHIDSGKTALARALSTTASTAAFDKQPQSRERGITLDLGFSCFSVPLPAHLRPAPGAGPEPEPEPRLQVTLVDCPGHASLIRTIIGGAQIIDLMMLVIDVTKGMQTQSAECLVIGQIACQKLVVVLNKTDLLPEGKKQAAIDRMTKKMQKTLESTKFRGAPVIPVAAKPGGPDAPETEAPQGIPELIELLTSQISIPTRDPSGPFLMSVDHCFSIKGQGTVMTGTILSGSVSLGDSVEIPALKVLDDHSVIGRSLFKKETNIQLFVGLRVQLSTGELGVIDSAFGQSGKFKVHVPGECGDFLLLAGTVTLPGSAHGASRPLPPLPCAQEPAGPGDGSCGHHVWSEHSGHGSAWTSSSGGHAAPWGWSCRPIPASRWLRGGPDPRGAAACVCCLGSRFASRWSWSWRLQRRMGLPLAPQAGKEARESSGCPAPPQARWPSHLGPHGPRGQAGYQRPGCR